jgi:glycosyltransferase involved in cell wall biosynthesis
MLVGICDFPSQYDFPPHGYGGIERWLWATAVGAKQAGADVHLIGPQWRSDLDDDWTRRPIRLEDLSDGRYLRHDGYDLLIVGHEYLSLPAWRRVADETDADVATFQHWPHFAHRADAFDSVRRRLYCYSTEMVTRYAQHRPVQELAVHLGHDEAPPMAEDGESLVWLGRVDAEKAPHLAIAAAGLLGRRITIVGPIFDPAYIDMHRRLFEAVHVTMAGELGGAAKVAAVSGARALVYTTARDYIEAGAAVFGESLRAGTPVAGLAWREGTCADAALCADTGRVAVADPDADDSAAIAALAEAIAAVTDIKASTAQDIGLIRFDPARHFAALARRP